MNSRMWLRSSLLLSLCLLILAPLLAAQEASPAPDSTFGEAVDVRIVNVDVFVTDKKGRRVSGLRREDFTVYQDGRPVELTNFSRASRHRVSPDTTTPELPAGLSGEPLPVAVDPMTVVIYVDNSTLTPPHRNRVLDEIETFVAEQSGLGVRFMIAVYNPGLKILTPELTDPARAGEILAEIAQMPASGLTARAERRQAMNLIQDVYELYDEAGPGLASNPTGAGIFSFDPCDDGWAQMVGAVDTYAQVAGDRVRAAQAGLLGLTRSLGGIPGRKAVLYLSDGWEQYPGIDMYGFLGELCPRRDREMFGYMNRWDETPLLYELAEYANAHRLTLYALETTGLTSHSAASVEFDGKRFTPSARNDTLRISNLQNSLFVISDETGGQAFLNTNSPGPELARMAEDFSDYYSLGFVPPAGWDGISHRIRVELNEGAPKGARLRYRQRYRAIPDDERMAERTLATLVLGWEDNPLGSAIRIGDPEPGDDGTWEVPVEIVLPRGALGSRAKGAGERQLVRVLMIAEDARSRRTPMREKVIPIVYGPDGAPAESDSSLIVNVTLEPGTHTVAVGVRDELNRITSYHRATVEISADRQATPES